MARPAEGGSNKRPAGKVASIGGAARPGDNTPGGDRVDRDKQRARAAEKKRQAATGGALGPEGPQGPGGPATQQVSRTSKPTEVKYQIDPHPSTHPHLYPGESAVKGTNYMRGTITRYQFDKYEDTLGFGSMEKNYGFRMAYNPNSITYDSPFIGNLINNPDDLSTALFRAGFGSISFELLLNRTEDMAYNTVLTDRIRGATDMKELGTLYDIEWLHRVIGGDPRLNPNGASADRGYLVDQVVRVAFGGRFSLLGRFTDITVNHMKFSARMVPMVSMLKLSLVRYDESDLLPGEKDTINPATGVRRSNSSNVGFRK